MKPSFISSLIPTLFLFQFLSPPQSIQWEWSCYGKYKCVQERTPLDQLEILIQKWPSQPEALLLQSPSWDKICTILSYCLESHSSQTKGRDPHIHSSCTPKQTSVLLLIRMAFGSAGVFPMFSSLYCHSHGLLCSQHFCICRIRSNGRNISNPKIEL